MEQLIFNSKNFQYEKIRKAPTVKRPRGNNGGFVKGKIKDIICAFDIETTNIKKEKAAIMYAWAFDLKGIGTITGRTWEEFKSTLKNIKEELNEDEKIIIYCHNLNFEFQFLSGIYKFKDNEVFATDRRDVLTCIMMNNIEFRCSYQKSGMKLEAYLKKWDVKHKKLKYDYKKPRYPHTKLSAEEWRYILNDVQGLTEAIEKELNFYGDTLITTPATKTGYIRRQARRELGGFARTALKDQLLTMEVYPLMKEAFRGGNCIDNRYTRGDIIKNPEHWDRSSSYPAVQLLPEFPAGAWHRARHDNIDMMIKSISLNRAIIARVAFYNFKLIKKTNPAPYIMTSKCRRVRGAEIDGGRILRAEYIELTLTEIDLEIILNQYTFDHVEVGEWWFNRKGNLPVQLTDLIKNLYAKKTALKNKPGADLEYIAAKTELDSLYGLSVQDPCRRYYRLYDGEWQRDQRPLDDILQDANKRAFLSYSYGVWTTALARRELQKAIDAAGDRFLYSDTDSVWTDGPAVDFKKLNKEIIKAAKAAGGVALDFEGAPHYIGAWEQEKAVNQFKCLGAKRYATSTRGKIEITLAGIDKEKGAKELKERGGLEALKDGFTFYEAGGMEAIYNDYKKPRGFEIQGHKYRIGNNVFLQKRKITLGAIGEIEMLLTRPEIYERIFQDD